jgi:ubiquitin C-terminal hydrolase
MLTTVSTLLLDACYICCATCADRPEVYSLHSVLVHRGDVHGGHYYAYIRPSADVANGQWAKFDDESVTLVDSSEVCVLLQLLVYSIREASGYNSLYTG